MEKHRPQLTVDQVIDQFGVGLFQVRYIFILGLIEAVDAIEFTTLAILAPLLKCSWHISPLQGALLITTVYLGICLGSPAFCSLSDRYGRKITTLVSCALMTYFNFITSLAPTIGWLYFLRFVMGTGIGGTVSMASAIMIEFSPRSFRAKSQALVFILLGLGCLFIIGVAVLVVPHLGWRWLIVFASLPALIGTLCLFKVYESPRYLLLAGEEEKAKSVLHRMAIINKVPMPDCDLQVDASSDVRGAYSLLFHRKMVFSTICLLLAWFVSGLAYIGSIFISSQLPLTRYQCLQDSTAWSHVQVGNNSGERDVSCCTPLTSSVYIAMTASACGDLLAPFIILFVLDIFGRKRCMITFSVLTCICFVLLDLCMSTIARNALLLLLRTFAGGLFDVCSVYTLEFYPTSIRATGIGVCSAFSKVGGAVTPFFAQVLLNYNARMALFLYATFCGLTAIVSALLPIETRDIGLAQIVGEVPTEARGPAHLLHDSKAKTQYEAVQTHKTR